MTGSYVTAPATASAVITWVRETGSAAGVWPHLDVDMQRRLLLSWLTATGACEADAVLVVPHMLERAASIDSFAEWAAAQLADEFANVTVVDPDSEPVGLDLEGVRLPGAGYLVMRLEGTRWLLTVAEEVLAR